MNIKKKRNLDGVKSTIRGIEGAIEITIVTLIYYFVWRNGYVEGTFPAYYGNGKYVLTGIYALLVLVLFFNFDGFKFGYLRLSDVLISQWIALFIANFITYWQLCLIANVVITPVPMLVLMVADVLISFACAYCYSVVYHRLYVPKKMVMIYGSSEAVSLKLKMDTRCDKYRITKLVSVEEGFERICRQIEGFDAVVINDISAEMRNDILKYCYNRGIRTYVAPKISDIIVRGAKSINLFDTPLLLVKGRGLTMPQRVYKRIFDVVVCSLAMVVAAPIMLLVAIAIKIEDRGPVFYTQKRMSLDGQVFDILKFRSMIVDAEKEGRSIPATEHDPRITRVGAFTRATRIDELPQLLNILKGDMSIVGPRPERVEHMEKYSRDIPEFNFRLKVKGGLTGYAQIYGKYNTSPYDKLRLDLMYIENYSFMTDLKLILMTIRIMLKKESTEGFDKAEELERLKQEMLANMHREESADEERMVGAGKNG
ncbi:MAG: sugar transferase [Oscillospiraceae bacterium]|nr:sugar transferase [Oscillospiraceae bacterium]